MISFGMNWKNAMSKDRYLLTQSLLTAWEYQYSAFDPEAAHQDFLRVLYLSLIHISLAGGTKEDIAGVFVGDLKYWGNPFTYEASVVDYSTRCV